MLAEMIAPLRPIAMLLLIASLWLSLGCGGSTGEQAQVSQLQIIGGSASPPSQNAVVQLVNGDEWATGVVVTPRLVMTARHVIFTTTEDSKVNFNCEKTAPVGGAIDPSKFQVRIGDRTPLIGYATGTRSFGGPNLNLCDNDIALLEVDQPLDAKPFSITPLALRLQAPPQTGEQGVLVGWGKSSDSLEGIGSQRLQRTLTVAAVGPQPHFPLGAEGMADVSSSTFLTTEGGCFDIGAPLISAKTGAVIGIMSGLQNTAPVPDAGDDQTVEACAGTDDVFTQLISQRDWIEAAFADAGESPHLEGFSAPADLGASCQSNPDCASGRCARVGTKGFCSTYCDASLVCPADMQCVGNDADSRCIPKQYDDGTATSSACAVAGLRARYAPWYALVLSALTLSVRRRRAVSSTSPLRQRKSHAVEELTSTYIFGTRVLDHAGAHQLQQQRFGIAKPCAE